MRFSPAIPLCTLLALAFVSLAPAGTLEGTLTFDKRNPYVGLVYFSDAHDGGPELCGSLDQKDKAFSKMLVVGKTGCDITFHNSDDLDHNIYANDLQSGINFDVGIIPPGGDAFTTVSWHEGHLVRLGCKIHPKMSSYIANLGTRHFAVVEFSPEELVTRFTLDGVPDELSEVTIILQPIDPITVTIRPGESSEFEITHKGNVFGKLELSR